MPNNQQNENLLKDRDSSDLIKIGETTHGELRYGTGNQNRYSQSELDEMNARYFPLDTGTKSDMYELQNFLLEEYKDKHGVYPQYNNNGR